MPQQGYTTIPDGNSSAVLERSSRSRLGIILAVGGLLIFLMQITFLSNNGIGFGESENPKVSLLDDIGFKFWSAHCLINLKISRFNFLDTDNYDKWYKDDSTMQLAQSGTFTGPNQMTEYVDFTKAKFFDKYVPTDGSETKVLKATKDQCEVMVAVPNKMQVNPMYSKSGEGMCVTAIVGFKLNYSTGPFAHGFTIKRTDLFYPDKFLPILFNDAIGGPGVTDFICDTVLRDNCQDVYKANGLDEESCKTMYNDLPPTDSYGYLDEKTKGCRILHSAFAEYNDHHCPHMSFIPIKDYAGNLWCQESGGVKAEDLWSDDELAFIKQVADDNGFDPDTLSTTCDYEPIES